MDGRAKKAQVYPPKLVEAILKGFREQLISDALLRPNEIGTVCCEEGVPDFENFFDYEATYDEYTGAELPPELVEKAKQEELETYRKHAVYTKMPRSECFRITGKPPIGVRWVISNKGDAKNPEIRARLVAKEIKRDKREDLFAATPPLEAKKVLFSQCVSRRSKSGKPLKLAFIDIKRAYFHAPAIRKVFVELPSEDKFEGGGSMR